MGNDFTLSFWFRLANGVSASSNGIIAGIGSTSSDGLSFSVINYKPECNFEGTKSLSGFSMEVDEWYNIVMVKKESVVHFYIDGSYIKGSNENIGAAGSGTSDIFLGRSYDGTSYSYTGTSTNLSRVMVYTEALKASSLRQNYLALRARYK